MKQLLTIISVVIMNVVICLIVMYLMYGLPIYIVFTSAMILTNILNLVNNKILDEEK